MIIYRNLIKLPKNTRCLGKLRKVQIRWEKLKGIEHARRGSIIEDTVDIYMKEMGCNMVDSGQQRTRSNGGIFLRALSSDAVSS